MELTGQQFDVFLSYCSRDRARVIALADSLAKHAGLRVFLDRWYLSVGEPWLGALERALGSCRAAAICIGPGELGPWQQREMCLALDRQARDRDFRVIPVLLPGADPVLGFLGTNMWIDLRDGVGDDEFVASLVAVVRGTPPGPELAAAFHRARASICPYRGLLYFREEDAPFFLGREPIVDELQRTLTRAPLVSVVGASGSGKSSVVRAGLVPRLRRSHAPVWEVATMVPGDRPLRALAAAFVALLEPEMTEVDLLVETSKLAAALSLGEVSVRDVADRVLRRQPGSERVLLVVDQWEELYTLTHNAADRAPFIDQLLEATSHGVLAVVLTLRGDFVGQALADRQLADRLQGAQVNVGPMTEHELHQAIEQPARAVGLKFEPGLVESILSDVGSEPGHLPLLEFVLRQLWDQRRDDLLLHTAYREIGGLEGAIASRAEHVFDSLSEEEQAALRHLFLRLARPGDGQDYTRLRAVSTDISEEEWPLVHRLVDERLLVTAQMATMPDRTVEVSHEALLRHWSRLRTWLDRDREFLLWRERLRPMMNAWTERKEGDDSLLQGAFLVEAEKWRIERNADLSTSEQRYIKTSVQARTCRDQAEIAQANALAEALQRAATQEKERARQAEGHAATLRRRNVILLGGMLLLVAAAIFAAWQATQAAERGRENQRLLAQAYQESARQLLVEGRAHEAVPYLLAARQQGLDSAPLRMMFWAATRCLPLIPLLEHQGRVRSVAFSANGTRLVTASSDNTARVWDVATGMQVIALKHGANVNSAAFSPDGTRVVTASDDHTARVWDAATGTPITSPLEHLAEVIGAAFSSDGTRVVTASYDRTARVWEAATGTPLTKPIEHRGWVMSAAFSADGTRVVTASSDKAARVWDAATGKPLTGPLAHGSYVTSAAFSPDGIRVVTASDDGAARIWEAATGRLLTGPLVHQDQVKVAAFSPDGTRVVTASTDNTARVWDATTGKPLTSPLAHKDVVEVAAFSPDGTRVITASWDNTARVWDAATGKPLTGPLEHRDWVMSAAFSPDGTRVVTASDDGAARVWDASPGESLSLAHMDQVMSAAFSPDGTRVVTASADKTARVWDAATGKPLMDPLEHQDTVVSAAFSPDGTRVVTASADKTARVWDAATGKSLTGPLEHQDTVVSAAFSPDGTRVVTASAERTAHVWDSITGKPLMDPLKHQDTILSAAFTPNGTRIVAASADTAVRLWEVATGKPLRTGLEGLAPVVSAGFSPDGALMILAKSDRLTGISANINGALVRLIEHQTNVASAALSPEGTVVVTTGNDNTARLWVVDDFVGSLRLSGERISFPHRDRVLSTAFSPDGTHMVTTSADNTARVWDVTSGKLLGSALEHQGPVFKAAFSPDGTRVVTASYDKTARVWDAATGKLLTAPLAHEGEVVTAAFSADGTRVVTASYDKTARVWDLRLDLGTLEEWFTIAERSPFVLKDGVLVRGGEIPRRRRQGMKFEVRRH